MEGVHPDLVKVMHRAIEITPIDFTVLGGLRSRQRQAQLVAQGASQTMNSRHLTGHALDIAPYVDGEVSWHWPHYYPLAEAVKQAAKDEGVSVRWGGVWDKTLNKLDNDLEREVSKYVSRRESIGKKAFIDGPHFELPREG